MATNNFLLNLIALFSWLSFCSCDHKNLLYSCLCSVSCDSTLNVSTIVASTYVNSSVGNESDCLLQNASLLQNRVHQESQWIANLCLYDSNNSSNRCLNHSNVTVPLFSGQFYNVNILTLNSLGDYVRQQIDVNTNNSWQVGEVDQIFEKNFSELSFNLVSIDSNTNGAIQFSVASFNVVAEISVHLKECPIGFSINSETMKCQCSNFVLNMTDLQCDTDYVTLTVPLFKWIGFINGTLSYSAHCLFGNCKPVPTILNGLLSIDSQCLETRSGTACGQCKKGLSAVFGDTSCMQCSNWYLLTILVYICAGIILVAGVFVFDLTITRGTVIAPISPKTNRHCPQAVPERARH